MHGKEVVTLYLAFFSTVRPPIRSAIEFAKIAIVLGGGYIWKCVVGHVSTHDAPFSCHSLACGPFFNYVLVVV
jgi:hypothetical protein